MPESFYEPDGDVFLSTDWTIGPWDNGSQHAGPPAALTARAIERLDPGVQMRVARFTFEILRPVPVAPLRVVARVSRPGKRVQFAEASLLTKDDVEVARASAWRIRTSPGSAPEAGEEPPPFAGPEACEPSLPFDPGTERSYFKAMEWRFAGGAFWVPGPAVAWMRMGPVLVAGEEPTPLARVLVAADSGNGISTAVQITDYLFINTELTVHLARLPRGDWVALDAATRIDPDGVGHTATVLWDETGRLGAANQSLLVAPR